MQWYLRERGYEIPECRPLVRTPEPRTVKGALFDPERVDKVIRALRLLPHTQGKWAGRPFEPDAWQVAYIIAPVFGWVAPNDDGELSRIAQYVFVELPRKNGKTSLGARLMMYLAFADGEAGAQVFTVAASKDQARHAFGPLKQIAQASTALHRGGVVAKRDIIEQPATGSYLQVVASVGDLLHGANVHAANVDELHVHRTKDVLEAVETGTGARTQPLVLIITTADDGRQDTVYAQRRELIEKQAKGTSRRNPTMYGVVFGVSRDADPFDEKTWKAANPGYGLSVSRAYLASKAATAKESPADLASFQRLHLGIRTKQTTKYIELDVWDRPVNATHVSEDAMRGRECYGGLDLAATSDLCALALDFPAADGSHDVIWRYWTPEDNIRRLDERTAGLASVWVRQGWLRTTPGDVVDYDFIRHQINEDRARFGVREIAYDPWNATQLVNQLTDDGAEMVKMRQGFISMSPPTKELLRVLREGKYRHGGNPLTRWCIDNLTVSMDAAGNVKPDKARSGEKIDGVVAAVQALDRANNRPKPRRSAYEDSDRGLMVV
ncbi:terminase large subunit [Micromonospora sp. DT227]|uniref:terminase large subunit n=1 Tax=Micromonospora sp. DT227 TaxID=3393433 RepID=UPI003CEF3FC5